MFLTKTFEIGRNLGFHLCFFVSLQFTYLCHQRLYPMNIHVIQHLAFEGAGCIGQWASDRQYALKYIAVFNAEPYPDPSDVQGLIILGGTMGAYEDHLYAWMPTEKAFIKAVIESGKPVLGICLGSQLLANVLGAKVFKHKHPEIGWHKVYLTEKGLDSPFFKGCEPVMKTMHWHGDTFELPLGADWLAFSEATPHQAFSFGANVLALQFHPEFDGELIQTLCGIADETLKDECYTQSTRQILKATSEIEAANRVMWQILDNFFAHGQGA
jgi:GMP synthase (glutamine-hydrolysing)